MIELIDLELPSGNLWMKHNMGATSEVEFGLYYQFGSLVGYSEGEKALKHSDWNTSPFNDGRYNFNKAYFKVNRHKWFYKNGLLRPEYDVVTQTYGKEYKIPTNIDFQELIDNTTSKYIQNYNEVRGLNGRLFTSMFNSNTLFIPFAGEFWRGNMRSVGSEGYLWSSRVSQDKDLKRAHILYCRQENRIINFETEEYCNSFPIRGIKVRDE